MKWSALQLTNTCHGAASIEDTKDTNSLYGYKINTSHLLSSWNNFWEGASLDAWLEVGIKLDLFSKGTETSLTRVLFEGNTHMNRCFLTCGDFKMCTVIDREPPGTMCTCPWRRIYLMLRVGNVHVTERNYECGGQRSSFPACSNSRGVLLQAQPAPPLFLCLSLLVESCPWNKAAGVRRSRHSIGMECSFLVQGPVSRAGGAQRSFETTDTCSIYFTPLSSRPCLLYRWRLISNYSN